MFKEKRISFWNRKNNENIDTQAFSWQENPFYIGFFINFVGTPFSVKKFTTELKYKLLSAT